MILMVTRNGKHCYAEIQLRTISQDTWAALEQLWQHSPIGVT